MIFWMVMMWQVGPILYSKRPYVIGFLIRPVAEYATQILHFLQRTKSQDSFVVLQVASR